MLQLHWPREVPYELKDVVDLYLNHASAEKYRQEDRQKNGGHLPERTTLHQNICFCLIRPSYDQCADPTYTQLYANLPTWDKLRLAWHTQSKCADSCACKKAPWFMLISKSPQQLLDGLICAPIECPQLQLDDDGEVPKLHQLECTRGECEKEACLAFKLDQLGECPTECGKDDGEMVRYRKYAKMDRTRNDGTEYTEVEFVYVREPRSEFMSTMIASIEAYVEHRRAHLWAVRQRKLLIQQLKVADSLSQLAQTLGLSETEAVEKLLAFDHEHHLTVTDHDVIIFTDFASRPKYTNAHSTTCEHPNMGTIDIAVVLHSPAKRLVTTDVTDEAQLSTGLEGMPVSDVSKAPQHVQRGTRHFEQQEKQSLICDVWCGYSSESADARTDQTFMRDIFSHYKRGHLVHAHAASHRGEPMLIGKNLETATISEHDKARVVRQTEYKRAKAEAAEAAAEKEAAAAAAAKVVAAGEQSADDSTSDEEAGSSAKALKKRKSAGTKKTPAAAASADGEAPSIVDTDRRGKLVNMRLGFKWSDGCGVQYVQREAALGTASMHGDVGVIAVHIVFEPCCFKYIHDAAGKVFSSNKDKAVLSREFTVTSAQEHYDYNADTMRKPTNENFNFDFSFSNYFHVHYQEENFVNLQAGAVEGIRSWRLTVGGTNAREIARGGQGGGAGYNFHSQPHVCFCGHSPCEHGAFTGTPTAHSVFPCVQEKADRQQATEFFGAIKKGTILASMGDLKDSTAGNEVLWLSIAKGGVEVAEASFPAAGGATIRPNWSYVDISYLKKIKEDSDGNVHYEIWRQPNDERTVLTRPKILCVAVEWLRVEEKRSRATRYVLSANNYQRMLDALKLK